MPPRDPKYPRIAKLGDASPEVGKHPSPSHRPWRGVRIYNLSMHRSRLALGLAGWLGSWPATRKWEGALVAVWRSPFSAAALQDYSEQHRQYEERRHALFFNDTNCRSMYKAHARAVRMLGLPTCLH